MKMPLKTAVIRPTRDLIIPDPATGHPLPEAGRRVVMDLYWRRRIAQGDVELVKEKQFKKKGRITNYEL